MKRYSLLDLAPVPDGFEPRDALSNSTALAIAAEKAGYFRFWVAEHHNMIGIASSATAVLVGHLASATSKIRVGAGGIMLPNHSPLMVAEQFGTLSTLHNGRIDLGLGRAPGTDMATARALRRHMPQEDSFPQDVQELMMYLGDMPPNAPVRAIPGLGTKVPVWVLGSSLYGAQLAAYLGLPYAFASHFAPDMLEDALHVYRSSFRPSDSLTEPYVVVAVNVCAADRDDEAEFLRSSQLLAFANIITNNRGKLPGPIRNIEAQIAEPILDRAKDMLRCSAVGGPRTLRAQLKAHIQRFQPDEIMATGMIYNHDARVRSFEIAAEIFSDLIDDSK